MLDFTLFVEEPIPNMVDNDAALDINKELLNTTLGEIVDFCNVFLFVSKTVSLVV